MKGVDQRFIDVAESWFRDTCSEKGYTPEQVKELAEWFQSHAESVIEDRP